MSRMLLDRYEVCETACKKARKMVNLEQTSLCKQKVQYGTYCTEAFDAASGGLDRGQARGHCFALPPHSSLSTALLPRKYKGTYEQGIPDQNTCEL